MSKLDSAVQRLYEDIRLREELKDDEARILLKWAEDKIAELDNEIDDEETFEQQFKQLRRVMKRMNRFIGYRSSSDLEEQQKMVAKFLDSAAELGIQVNQAQIQSFLDEQQNQPNDATLQSMLDMLKPAQTDDIPNSAMLFNALKNAPSEGETNEQEEQ